MSAKTNPGKFFEDFRTGQRLAHATPRTLTAGDVARLTVEEGQIVVDVVKGHIAAPCRPAPSTDRGGFGARTNPGA